MESVEVVTCGVDGHEEDCLCDVIVQHVTPVNVNAVQGLWMGQEVADACGLENWDDDQELLTYLCNVLLLHDKFIEEKQLLVNAEQLVPQKGEVHIRTNKKIRVTVRRAMCAPDARIMDVLNEHGYSVPEFTRAASNGHWEMDEESLRHFEQQILSGEYSMCHMSTRYGLDEQTIGRFRKFWPNRPEQNKMPGNGNHPRNIRTRQLIKQGVAPADIIAIIRDEFGVTLSKSAISQQKRRHNIS